MSMVKCLILSLEDYLEKITEGYIQNVHTRKNELKRPPVSNVDHLIIVMSAIEPSFSTQLLDRFLVIAHSYHMRPRILVTKKDLLTTEEVHKITELLTIYEAMGYQTQFVGLEDDISAIFDTFSQS